MKMRFAVGMGRNERIDEIGELSRAAEENGFDHLTFVDQQNISRDVYVMMTLAAVNTRRIRIGQGVTVPFTRHPSVTVNATATVNELSGGRTFLGIGIGGNALRSMGMGARQFAEFKELLEFVKRYCSGEEAEYHGAKMHSEWIRQPISLYVAASRGPKSLELAGEIADGVYTQGGPPEYIKWKIDHIYRGAERVGRDPSKIDICVRSIIYPAESKEKARREVSAFMPFGINILEGFGKYPEIAEMFRQLEQKNPGILDEMKRVEAAYDEKWHEHIDSPSSSHVNQRLIDLVHLVGTEEDICEGISRYAAVGVTTIATATYTVIDKKGLIREIGNKVLPHFRN